MRLHTMFTNFFVVLSLFERFEIRRSSNSYIISCSGDEIGEYPDLYAAFRAGLVYIMNSY